MHRLLSFLPTLSLHSLLPQTSEQQLSTSRHIWSSPVFRFSCSVPVELNQPAGTQRWTHLWLLDPCQADATETSHPPPPPTSPPPLAPDALKLSGNEVGLWDDALHFVIGGVRRCLVVTDRHFMSVSLKSTRRERLTAGTDIHRYTVFQVKAIQFKERQGWGGEKQLVIHLYTLIKDHDFC